MKLHLISLTFLLALSLSACTMQVNTTIRSDGSNELRMEIGFTAADKEMLSSVGNPMENICGEMESASDLPFGTTVTQEERDGATWCIVEMSFDNLRELKEMLEESDGITVNLLEISNGKLYYDLNIDTSSGDFGMDEPIPLTLIWQVTVPGKIGKNNADQVEGKTLTWNLPPGQSISIQVESSLTGGEFPQWLYALIPAIGIGCLCGFGILVIVGVLVFVSVRRRKSTPASTEIITSPKVSDISESDSLNQPNHNA